MTTKFPLPYQVLRQSLLKQGRSEISYDELLWTQEWLNYRNQIKDRDNETCTNCLLSRYKKMTDQQFADALTNSGFGKYFNMIEGKFEDEPSEFALKKNMDYPSNLIVDETVKLEVHHKYYIWKKLPWEYDPSALTTLCETCHENEHFQNPRIVYSDDSLGQKKNLITCYKCNGIGYIKQYEHVQNGICFNCWGYGGVVEGTEKNLFSLK